MLFNSPQFIFLFLPATAVGYFLLARFSRHLAAFWLVVASFIFYASWNGSYILLLLASICANYGAGYAIASLRTRGRASVTTPILAGAVGANLLTLGYFKYALFFSGIVNAASGTAFHLGNIVLPLGISFFTFTQIAFLVDTYRGKAAEPNFVHYLLFVSYFPHLIAGPILHHAEMMPQFRKREAYVFRHENLAIGLTIFCIGLFKKVVLADSIADYVTAPFQVINAHGLNFIDAWAAALSYTFQIYFDFSGYSDMAIGASRIFGIKLPLNFSSPYKSTSIIEFWRRWHMTLSRFLRDYLYFPLGGNRRGPARRYGNLLITMLLGGLWHGAGLTFVVWGGLHGLYLVVNHAWNHLRQHVGMDKRKVSSVTVMAAWLLTFIAVVIAWVFFRAPNLGVALDMVQAMAGGHGVALPLAFQHGAMGAILHRLGIGFDALQFTTASQLALLLVLLFIAVALPNTQQIMRNFEPALDFDKDETCVAHHRLLPAQVLTWRVSMTWALFTALIFVVSILSISRSSQFLYYQF